MAHMAPTKSKINTNPTQLACDRAVQRAPGGGKKSRGGRGPARVSGDTRESVRDSARVVVEAGCGILVYPPEAAGEPWRATFTENGRRRFRQAMTEAELAAKLEKVTDRLRAGAPESLQGAIAAGLLGLGSVFVGTIEGAAWMLQEELADGGPDGPDEERAARIVSRFRAERRQIPGFGHPIHKPADPRAVRLFEIAAEEQVAGAHCRLMKAVHQAAEEQYDRHLTLNVTAAIDAVASDLGMPWQVSRGIGVAARSVGLIAHLRDEQLAPTSNGIWHDIEDAQKAAAGD